MATRRTKAYLQGTTFLGGPGTIGPAALQDFVESVMNPATTLLPGPVMPDGTTITTDVNGVITAVVPSASNTTPVINGTAAAGSSANYARADHVHPTDTSRAPIASPTFTGTPAGPTPTAGTNTTQLATTAFVTTAVAGVSGGGGGTSNFTALATDPTATSGYTSTSTWLNYLSGLLWRYNGTKWVKASQFTATSTTTVTSPAYYVAASGGSNSNSGAIGAPFATLAFALSTAAGGSTKTIYMRGGTYSSFAGVTLGNSSYNGITISAYPGETPILDGGSSTATCITVNGGCSNVRINGLTIQNFTQNGIFTQGDGHTITNNTIKNINSSSTNMGAIYCSYIVTNLNISHNYIQNITGPGICLSDGGGGSEIMNNNTIDNNIVLNTNTSLTDSGGIYLFDLKHSITSTSITNNIVGNHGVSTSDSTKGIYLDDEVSYCTVTGNVVYGTGEYCFQIHAGNNNTIKNNVFDITGKKCLALYQDTANTAYGAAGNVFSNNVIYSSSSPPPTVWDFLNSSGQTMALPAVSNNLYYGSAGSLPNSGTIVDSNPTTGNPLFTNVSNRDYSMASGSPAFSSPVNFTTITVVQGP